MSSGVLCINEETGNVSFATRVKRAMRKCSFCCSTQHKVDMCNDNRLVEFHEKLRTRRESLRGLNRIDTMQYYKIWIRQFSRDLIKTYALRYCQVAARTNLDECIDFITQKMFSREFDTEEQYELELALERERILEQPEYIAFPVAEPSQIPRHFILTDDEISSMDPYTLSQYFLATGYTRADIRTSENRKYDIQIKMKKGSRSRKETVNYTDKDKDDCPICYDALFPNEFIKLNCSHEFCGVCLKNVLKTCSPNKEPKCAICRAHIWSFEFEDRKAFEKVEDNLCSTLRPFPI